MPYRSFAAFVARFSVASLLAACLGFTSLAMAQTTRVITTAPADVFIVYSVGGGWNVPAGAFTTFADAWASVQQRQIALAAELTCPQRSNQLSYRYLIPGGPSVASYDILYNGQSSNWIYPLSAEYCLTGNVSQSTARIDRLPICPQNSTGIIWQQKTLTVSSNSYKVWCEGTTIVPDLPTSACTQRQPTVGNPVYPATGRKVQREEDYRSADGALEFVRFYDNHVGAFSSLLSTRLLDRSSTVAPAGCFPSRFTWSTYTFSACFPYSNTSPAQSYQFFTGTGRQIAFSGPPTAIVARGDINERLVSRTDSQGQQIWQVARSDNTIELYNSGGFLTDRYWVDGKRMSVVYSDASTPLTEAPGPGYPIKHVDRSGRELAFAFDSVGNMARLTNPAGGAITFEYEAVPGGCLRGSCWRMKTATYYNEASRNYYFNDRGGLGSADLPLSLTGIGDELGVRVGTYIYDSQNRATSTERAGGLDKYSITYSSSTSSTAVDPLGSSRTYTLATSNETTLATQQSQPAGSGCAASTQQLTFDSHNNVTEQRDFNGNRTCFGYDFARNLQTARAEGITGTGGCGYYVLPTAILTSGARKITTQWHPDWRLETKRAEPKKVMTRVYNGQPDPFNGNAIASCAPGTALLPDGKPIAVLCKQVEQATTDANGSQGFSARLQSGVASRPRSWTYNASGQVLTESDPLNNTTTYAYYADTTADHTLGDLQSVANAAGQVTTFTKYDGNGQLLESTDPNGVVTTNTYDLRQRLLSTSVGGQTTSYEYDAAGQLLKVTQPDASWIGYEYDAAHRQVAVKDNLGNRIEYVLDNAGNKTSQSVKDPGGNLARSLARSVDALGRVQQTTGRE